MHMQLKILHPICLVVFCVFQPNVKNLTMDPEDKVEKTLLHQPMRIKIEEVHVGRDGNVRSVTLRDDKNNRFKRPIQNLVLLEGAKDN